MKLATIFLLAVSVAGCAAPGTPVLRTGSLDGEGALIPGCKNVSKGAKVVGFITDSYLTTWGSPWIEGAMEGFWEGISDGFDEAAGGRRPVRGKSAPRRTQRNSLPFYLEPFCMGYRAPVRAVSRAVTNVLARLKYPIRLSDEANGAFETEFVSRQNPVTRWQDKYVISIEMKDSQTVVKMLRVLYISRTEGTFNRAISVGHNEAWILSRVADLTGRPASAPERP